MPSFWAFVALQVVLITVGLAVLARDVYRSK